MPLLLDTKELPLATVTISGDVSVSDVQSYTQEIEALLVSGKRFVIIVQVVGLGKVDRSVLKLYMDWNKKNAELSARQWLGLALYFSSGVARFLFSSMLLLGRFPMPYTTVNTMEEARSWALEILRKNGLTPRK